MERLSSDCDSQPGKQSNIAASASDARPNLPKSDLLTKQRTPLDEDLEGSNDSLNVISKAADVSLSCDKRRTDVMFRSDYHCPSDTGSSHTRVADSRNMRARESRSTVSRDPSPRNIAISAPATPFRRERSSAEYENSKLSIRQPKRQTVTSGANYAQSISTTSRSGAQRSQSTRVLRDTSPSSYPAGVSLDEDSLTTSRKTNWLRSSMSRVTDERVRTSMCGGDPQYSTNLRKPSSMRSTVHSKSSVELSSNRASCAPTKNATQSADSFTFLALLDRDKPTVNSPLQENALVSRASIPLARFSIQTLEEIEERPSSQPSICRASTSFY
ncbi:hypothetical protein AHF37_06632 [Paragonimus kellicotti]|nr:hypothetical protein AHF37_06632 [Paragonimus kellicotti]